MYCSKCGAEVKADAHFCQECGTKVGAEGATSAGAKGSKTWLETNGAFLFIPVFAIIVVLLFWSNREPDPIAGTQSASMANGGPQMQAVHATLNRLKNKVQANPQDLVSIDSLAVMFAIAGNFEKSREFYEQHLAAEPDNKDIKIALALTNHNLENEDKALSLLNEVLDEEPTYAFALHYMAEIQSDLNHRAEAMKYWQKIVDTYPGTEFAKIAKERMLGKSAEK